MSDLLNALLAKHAAYQATLDAKRAKDEAEEALAEDRRAAKLAAREERKLHPKAKEPKAKKASKLPAILFKIEPALSALAFLVHSQCGEAPFHASRNGGDDDAGRSHSRQERRDERHRGVRRIRPGRAPRIPTR
jgi:hypothetical protein